MSNVNNEQISLEYEKAKKYNEKISQTFFSYNNYYNEMFSNYENILNLSGNGIMGYIEIPAIGSVLPIYHGVEDETMKKGVGHLKQTSLPIGGKSTHCVLTGHTGLLRAEIFSKLNELKIDDYFYIKVLEESLVYKVNQINVVLPEQTENLKIVDGKDLVTLVTCTPYGVNTHRLLVCGERQEDTKNSTYEESNFLEDKKMDINLKRCVVLVAFLVILLFVVMRCLWLKK